MFFKLRRLAHLLLAFVFAINTGCGLNTGEESAVKAPPSYSGKGFSCIGRIPEHFEQYFNDKLPDEEISTFTRCLQKAFTTFGQLTRGSSATTYTPNEIRNFLHDFFLGERRISDALLAEMMLLKQVIFGGSAELISREELNVAVQLLEEIRVEAIKLRPHIKYLNPQLARGQDPKEFGHRLVEARGALESAIQAFTKRVQKNHPDYTLANLEKLLRESRIFVGWDEHFRGAVDISKWINFLKVFRELTVASANPQVVKPPDWSPMLQSLANWYLIYLQYEVGVKGQPLFHGTGLQNAIQLAWDGFKLVEQAIHRQKTLSISLTQLQELATAVDELGWLPKGVRLASVHSALKAIVTRVLGDPDILPSRRNSSDLDLESVTRARSLFYRWAYVQLSLETRFHLQKDTNEKEVPSLQSRPYLSADLREEIQRVRRPEWEEFFKVTRLMRPLFGEDPKRIMLVYRSELSKYSVDHDFHNLSMMNLWRAATALIFRGYAEQSVGLLIWGAGVTSDELQKFYEDFRGIAIDLRLADERNTNTGSRAFMEGNLFTYSANGLPDEVDRGKKARLDYVEAIELFSFLYSGGLMANAMYQELKNFCSPQKYTVVPHDGVGRGKILRRCVQEFLTSLLARHLTNMPGLHSYLRTASPEAQKEYALTILEAAYSPHFSVPEWVELSELSTLAVVLHYAEAVMTRYDVDGDGLLTNPEVDMASETFMGFIKTFAQEKMGKQLSDKQANGVFYYILTEKEMPRGIGDIFIKSYLWKGKVTLDRSSLATVFKVIISKLYDTGLKADPAVNP